VAESGVAGFEYTGWVGMFAPKATPRPIVDRVRADIVRVVNDPDVKQMITSSGLEPLASTPDEFTAKLKSEIPRWTRVARESGIKAD
jgi:tripartite-type tricarboxylate transporter receptor subunit TctC